MDVLFGNTAILLLFVTVICNMKEHLQIFRKTFQLKFFFFLHLFPTHYPNINNEKASSYNFI